MTIEGSLETSHLLEQVRFRGSTLLFALIIEFYSRLRLSEELYIFSEWKIRTSRVKIYLREIKSLPLLVQPIMHIPTPVLSHRLRLKLKQVCHFNSLIYLLSLNFVLSLSRW